MLRSKAKHKAVNNDLSNSMNSRSMNLRRRERERERERERFTGKIKFVKNDILYIFFFRGKIVN